MPASLTSPGLAHGRGEHGSENLWRPPCCPQLHQVNHLPSLPHNLSLLIASTNRSSPIPENAWWKTSEVLARDFQ